MSQLSSRSNTLETYKKRLLIQVVSVFTICLIVILERIFYEPIVAQQLSLLSNLQLATDLTNNVNNIIVVDQIGNGFLQFFLVLSSFRVQFLIVTHIFITAYVAYDALITTKVMYATFAVLYFISLLQIIYAGARPFWDSERVLTSHCLQQYNHPSIGLILLLTVPAYFWFCTRRSKLGKKEKSGWKTILGVVVWLVSVAFVQFMNYFLGSMLLINIALSLVTAILIAMVLVSANAMIDKVIKKSTIMRMDSKRYSFYWLLMICILETAVLVVYAGQDTFLDIDWVKNYMSCTKYLQYAQETYRFDEVVGPWFNFTQTATTFGWIGAVFGVSNCFRQIEPLEWYKGPKKSRLLRAVIGNLFVVPSWLFVLLLQNNGDWIAQIGLNAFIVDSLHYFILYLCLFGFIPIFILHKLCKITNTESQDYYVIMEDRKSEEN